MILPRRTLTQLSRLPEVYLVKKNNLSRTALIVVWDSLKYALRSAPSAALSAKPKLKLEPQGDTEMPNYDVEIRSGSRCHNAKLTEDMARDIYIRAWSGEKQTKIAADYGLNSGAVSKIKHRQDWFAATSDLYKKRIKGEPM